MTDSLPWDWWKQPLPDTLGDERNFMLTADELKQYASVLAEMKQHIEREEKSVRATVRAIETKRVLWYEEQPRPTTLAHVLEFCVTMAKDKLALMHVLLKISGARVERKRACEI